jgi:hypothetical protein
MARRGWRYFATRLNGNGTETLLDMDLPIEDVQIEDVLSGDQSLNCKIDPAFTRLRDDHGVPILHEWGTGIYAESDGDIRFGGILTHSGFNGPEWGLECVGFTGYARDMPWTAYSGRLRPPGWTTGTDGGGKGVKVDPLDVVRVLWDQIQEQPGGNIGLVPGDTTTGGKVLIGSALAADQYDPAGGGIDGVALETQAYQAAIHSLHDIAGDIDSLAGATPFDYHERHQWKADGTIGHYLDFGYPKIGRKRDDLRFVFGVNIFESPSVDNDGDIYASGTLVLGRGDGAGARRALVEPPSRPQNRLRRIAVVTDDTLRSNGACRNRAEQENAWRRNLDDITSFTAVDHPNARLGAAKVGDTIRIEGQGDWKNFDVQVRILSIAYEPANGKIAQYTVARTDKLTS